MTESTLEKPTEQPVATEQQPVVTAEPAVKAPVEAPEKVQASANPVEAPKANTPDPVVAPTEKAVVEAPSDEEKAELKREVARLRQVEQEQRISQELERVRQLDEKGKQEYQSRAAEVQELQQSLNFHYQQYQAAVENQDIDAQRAHTAEWNRLNNIAQRRAAELDNFTRTHQETISRELGVRNVVSLKEALKTADITPDDLIKAEAKAQPDNIPVVLSTALKVQREKLTAAHKEEIKQIKEAHAKELQEVKEKWKLTSPATVLDTAAGASGNLPVAMKMGATRDLLRKAREAGQL